MLQDGYSLNFLLQAIQCVDRDGGVFNVSVIECSLVPFADEWFGMSHHNVTVV